MPEQFISAAIQPITGTFDAARMSTGEPGLPRQFRWGSRTIQIAEVLKTWRETGPCRHGSGESYVRKHWFEVRTDSGDIMKIYFERQPRSRRNSSRWRLFTIDNATVDGLPHSPPHNG
jgi:phosphoribosylglycinamide formyltransferase-1